MSTIGAFVHVKHLVRSQHSSTRSLDMGMSASKLIVSVKRQAVHTVVGAKRAQNIPPNSSFAVQAPVLRCIHPIIQNNSRYQNPEARRCVNANRLCCSQYAMAPCPMLDSIKATTLPFCYHLAATIVLSSAQWPSLLLGSAGHLRHATVSHSDHTLCPPSIFADESYQIAVNDPQH